jgi:hypothetical protein
VGAAALRRPLSGPVKGAEIMPTATTRRFDVTYLDDETGQRSTIGQVDVGPDSKLTLVSAVPDRQEFLTDLVEELNEEDEMHVKAAPPPGAPRYAVYSKIVPRSDPKFFDAMKDFLGEYYDVTLTPA